MGEKFEDCKESEGDLCLVGWKSAKITHLSAQHKPREMFRTCEVSVEKVGEVTGNLNQLKTVGHSAFVNK